MEVDVEAPVVPTNTVMPKTPIDEKSEEIDKLSAVVQRQERRLKNQNNEIAVKIEELKKKDEIIEHLQRRLNDYKETDEK